MPAERYSLGTVTVRVIVQGPIGISATAPVVAVRYDDGTWDAEAPRQHEVLQWTIAGARAAAGDPVRHCTVTAIRLGLERRSPTR